MAHPTTGTALPDTITTQIEAYLDATQAALGGSRPSVPMSGWAIGLLEGIKDTCDRTGIPFETAEQEIQRRIEERASAKRTGPKIKDGSDRSKT